MRIAMLIAGLATMTLAACGGGSVPPDTTLESYVTDHNQFTRSRLNRSTEALHAADTAILRAFDTVGSHAGYANLFADADIPDRIEIEVIAQVAANGRPTRILRITADQSPFTNDDGKGNLVAGPDSTESYHYRGDATIYAQIDGGALMVARSIKQTNIEINFATGAIDLNLRTGEDITAGSAFRSELTGTNLTLDRQTGQYGGDVSLRIWSNNSPDIYTATGQLRAGIGATALELKDHLETSSTSGVFTASGDRITADGLFWAVHPNAR